MESDLTTLSALDVQERLTAKRTSTPTLTVEAYARALLDHLTPRDKTLHAWVYVDAEQVISQAKKLDQIPASQRGPLHGLPIGVKDILLTQGTY
jgi:Asp-tRNA(Asn)/Glu-tRNA(Gln) amidotransferase A subunit family amidase